DLLRGYQRMGDDEFTYLATHEAPGLTPEALVVVRAELRRRATVPDADAAIDVQFRAMKPDEFERMLARFRQEPCPRCGREGSPLNAVRVGKGERWDTVVGCMPCLLEATASASRAAGVFGLFSLFGIGGPGGALRSARSAGACRPGRVLTSYQTSACGRSTNELCAWMAGSPGSGEKWLNAGPTRRPVEKTVRPWR